MKRQLERLKGKRLVTGDPNLMTKDEICINATPNGGVEVKEIGTDGKIKDLVGSGDNGGGNSSGEVKERWVSIDISTVNPDLDFKELTVYYPTKLGYRVLNELCDMFIGLAAIQYSSGNGYAISGGTMNIGELNNIRKGVTDYADKQFVVRALKFREVNNSNKFIDIAAGAPQHTYEGGLGNLDTLSLYPILLNHNFWKDKNKEERLFLTVFAYSVVMEMKQVDEDVLLKDLYNNNITIEDLFVQNGITEEFINMFPLIYINKEEELNKVIEYINNYDGYN